MPPTTVVRAAPPIGVSLGNFMNEIRMWLDSQKIEPVSFRSAPGATSGFEIAFDNAEDAERFRRHFNV
jgi:hypothetical protein